MTTTPARLRRGAVALGLLLAALPAAAAADEPREVEALCLDGRSGDATYDAEVTGKKRKTEHSGDFSTVWTIGGPACVGVDYVLTVRSSDLTALGWTTTKVTTTDVLGASTTLTPLPVPAAATSVRVVFPGDGRAVQFVVHGTTRGYAAPCLDGTVTMEPAGGGHVAGEAASFTDCEDPVSGGSSYY